MRNEEFQRLLCSLPLSTVLQQNKLRKDSNWLTYYGTCTKEWSRTVQNHGSRTQYALEEAGTYRTWLRTCDYFTSYFMASPHIIYKTRSEMIIRQSTHGKTRQQPPEKHLLSCFHYFDCLHSDHFLCLRRRLSLLWLDSLGLRNLCLGGSHLQNQWKIDGK